MFKFFKEYFNLSNNEQRGVIALLLIIILVFIAPKLYTLFKSAEEIPADNTKILAQFNTPQDSTEIDAFNEEIESSASSQKLFPFNPNTVSKNQLIELGFTEKTASTLLNYRNKGGKFYKKEDLKKVYGVSDNLYNDLKDYIVLDNKKVEKITAATEHKNETTAEKTKEKETLESSNEKIYVNINTADSTELRKIKGVGAVFAGRIIKYRDLLGGFNNKEQLLEVYGMKPEMYENIAPQVYTNGKIKTININKADWKTLKNHPYLSTEKASIISKYVKTHGAVKNIDEIINTSIFSQSEIDKITPYLSIE